MGIVHHHHGHCGHHHHGHHGGLGFCEAEIIKRIPVLRYLKEPVAELNDLYKCYPTGGQPGWFAWVYNEEGFAYWHHGENKWKLVSKGDIVLSECYKVVNVVPTPTDEDGLYLVAGQGVYVVESGTVIEIVKNGSVTMPPSVERLSGYNTVNTLVNLPINKQTVIANVGSNETLSLNGVMGEGDVINIAVYATADIKITLPSGWMYMDGSELDLSMGDVAEINLWHFTQSFAERGFIKTYKKS